jgi:transcriptional regulator with XRE-family HTH domain
MNYGQSTSGCSIALDFFSGQNVAILAHARLTQQQLADRIGTKQSVIARLEDAEYEGHSLSRLQKIARALNQRLEVHLIPIAPSENCTESCRA